MQFCIQNKYIKRILSTLVVSSKQNEMNEKSDFIVMYYTYLQLGKIT